MFKLVKVNNFQKKFDSKLRNFMFSWNQGHYLKYLKNRVQWHLYPNIKRVADFPIHMDIETTAKCNLSCPMCPRRYLADDRYNSFGHMGMDLFKKLVDECADNKIYSIRLSWRGEVLVNPNLADYVHYAKVVKKIPNVSFLTNGSLLKGEVAKKLIEHGLDYISVSIDGLDEAYNRIRKPLIFEKIYNNVKEFQELKRKMERKKPLIRVAALWPAIATDPDRYYEKISKIADKIVYNPLKDYAVTSQDEESFTMCQFLWERMFVQFDGKVQPCSNLKNEFVIGNANESSIKQIWHSDKMEELRSIHKAGRRLDIFPCNECSYGVDFEKKWKGRDWTNWDPSELMPKEQGNRE